MKQVFFKLHWFPSDAIWYAVWLYYRFTLSLRDVEELLAAYSRTRARHPSRSSPMVLHLTERP